MVEATTLSVGIPAYNQARYLGETIESLLAQTRMPLEIVVSDHDSTDGTAEIVARYAREYPGLVLGVRPPQGTNLTGQYNFTLGSLRGDWVTLLSSDDVARPEFCEVLLRGAERTAGAVLVRAGWEQIDESGTVLNQNYLLSVPRVERPPATLLAQKHGPKVNFAAFAVKREAFERSGPIDGRLRSLADWALFLQVAPLGEFVYEHALIAGYRVGHDGNKFRERLGMWVEDQQRIFAEVMPLAARRAGMTDTRWIGEASRYNFLRYLAKACEEFGLEERAGLVPVFAGWAEAVGEGGALRRFAVGKRIATPIPFSRRMKTRLRPLLQRVLGGLRRG